MIIQQFLKLLNDDNVTVTVKSEQGQLRIAPTFNYIVSEDGTDVYISVSGYEVQCGETESCAEDETALVKLLENAGAVKKDEVEAVSINDTYSTLEEYEEKLAFDNIDMAGLLEKFLPIADSFSLTCPYNDGFDREHMFGIYDISDELAEKAIDILEREQYSCAEQQFATVSDGQKKKLPAFDKLYEEIKDEYERYFKKHIKKAKKYGGTVFFCDVFGAGKAKYKEPAELWHIYQAVDFIGTCKYSLGQMKKNSLHRPVDCELDGEEYRGLKDSLIKTEVTFSWHCTTSGALHKVLFFALNEKTVGWLSKLKNDYELKGLEDLAFYKDGRVIFSSCTHERFHTNLINKRGT